MADVSQSKKILLVADYGKNDLAFYEVKQRLHELAEQAGLVITVDTLSVDPFNTAQTAAVVAQAAARGNYDLIYHNTAPRKDNKKERPHNDGEFLAYAQLANSRKTKVIGVYSGDENSVNTFALLPRDMFDHHPEIFRVDCLTNGSQFRSRDVFPPHVIAALKNDIALKERIDVPPPLDASMVVAGRQKAGALLANASAQPLACHEYGAQAYRTIIGPAKNAAAALGAFCSKKEPVETDFLPLKAEGETRWIQAAFLAAQLALNSRQRYRRTIVALTGENSRSIEDAPYQAMLDNGVTIITDDLRTLAFVKERVAHPVYRYADEAGEGTMVSREEWETLARRPEHITPVWTDGYGNIKLSIGYDDLLNHLKIGKDDGQRPLESGERLVAHVGVGGKEADTYIADGSFNVEEGETALSKGSSGWAEKHSVPGKNHFIEIFLRGGSAAEKLSHPQPGDYVRIVPKERLTGQAPSAVVDGLDSVKVRAPGHSPQHGIGG